MARLLEEKKERGVNHLSQPERIFSISITARTFWAKPAEANEP